MSKMSYYREVSNPILNHYLNPQNCGVLDRPTAIGEWGDPDKGIKIKFYLSIQHNCIEDITFQTFGCVTSIASASMLTKLVKGKAIAEISHLTAYDVSKALHDVPPEKMYCCELVIGALRNGVKNFANVTPIKK